MGDHLWEVGNPEEWHPVAPHFIDANFMRIVVFRITQFGSDEHSLESSKVLSPIVISHAKTFRPVSCFCNTQGESGL